MFQLKGKALFAASTTLAATGFLLFGYDQGVMSGIVDNEHWKDLMGFSNESSTSALVGAVVALYEIGCMFGALVTGKLGDMLGRRNTIRLGSVILIIGAVLQTATVNMGMTIASRIITGFGNGMNTATVPVYQSEVSPPKSRGAHVCFECFLLVVGIGIAYWLEYGLYFVGGEFAWRFPLAFQNLFALILIAGTFVLPETPRWLVAHDRDEEAKEVLARLWTDGDKDHPRCIAEYEEIRDGIDLERREGISSYKELFSKGKFNNRYRVCLGMLSQIIQQLCGINVTTYYLATVMAQAGMDRATSMLMAGVDSIVYGLGSLLPIVLVERIGRRKIMIWGLVLQTITLVCIGGCQKAQIDGFTGAGSGAVAFTMLYNFVFGASWLGMAWLYPAEIFSTGLRAKGNSFSTAANWLGNFVVAMIAPVLFEYITFWTYILFAFLNVIFTPMVYFWFPETKGLSLEQIEILFATEELKDDAKSVASHIGSNYDSEKPHDPENGSVRPKSYRNQSNLSQDVQHASSQKFETSVSEKAPNYK
ncbi:general substrate transporter [Radiomyces spectabilis]|uniref:general substrate transporter n=1 Tax=Radiomyces spectabilis TaxID=64574 RepID=UPI00221F37B2|nr:general substrate transporter [Radiomyces spectabilis]KAI8381271.1 general substrate transporter [Radiomyces spectabilis]